MTILYAHRGASVEEPENTLEAFARAVELGVDAIETDVRLTADERVVVHHDATGRRMARDPRAIRTLTFNQVRELDVGAAFDPEPPMKNSGVRRAPLLAEALSTFPHMRFNVDIKDSAGAVPHVLRVVDDHAASDRVLLTSFHDRVLEEVRSRGYRGETGLARNGALRALALASLPIASRALRPAGDRIQIPASQGPLVLSRPGLVANLQRLGYAVDFWVINDPVEALRLLAVGADGIMTDDPRTILTALGR
ncbi:MAG: glycerophosphodiester phosphodiesterase family protein [Polyangiaceae bacterium]